MHATGIQPPLNTPIVVEDTQKGREVDIIRLLNGLEGRRSQENGKRRRGKHNYSPGSTITHRVVHHLLLAAVFSRILNKRAELAICTCRKNKNDE